MALLFLTTFPMIMNTPFSAQFFFKTCSLLTLSIALSACGDSSWWNKEAEKQLDIDQIKTLVPVRVKDRSAWAKDIFDITDQLGIAHTKENMCSIVAVVDQESNFVADPQVPGLGEKAVKKYKIV